MLMQIFHDERTRLLFHWNAQNERGHLLRAHLWKVATPQGRNSDDEFGILNNFEQQKNKNENIPMKIQPTIKF